MAVPKNMWVCPSCLDYVENYSTVCPHCGFDRQQNEKQRIKATEQARTHSEDGEFYILEPGLSGTQSTAATVMRIISFVLWIGGVAVSIMSSRTQVYNSYRGYIWEFNWKTFAIMSVTFLLAGTLTMCWAELFENVQRIADAMAQMNITKRRK